MEEGTSFLRNMNHSIVDGYDLWMWRTTTGIDVIVSDNTNNLIGWCMSNLWDSGELRDNFINSIENFKEGRCWSSWDSNTDVLVNSVPVELRKRIILLILMTNGFNVLIFNRGPTFHPRDFVKPNNTYIITTMEDINDFHKIIRYRLKYTTVFKSNGYALFVVTGGSSLTSTYTTVIIYTTITTIATERIDIVSTYYSKNKVMVVLIIM